MTIVKEEADESMIDEQDINIEAKLSHSAKALLKTILAVFLPTPGN